MRLKVKRIKRYKDINQGTKISINGINQYISRRADMISARRIVGLVMLLVFSCVATFGQTLRSDDDPRNLAPTVSGGTGLFTVYDAQTLRKGEFNFGFFANYFHRDPGDLHFQVYPVNFQVGFSDHLEFFANFESQKQITAGLPALLSGFYLPDVRTKTLPVGRVVIRPGTTVVGTVVGDPCGNGGFAGPCSTFGPFKAFPSGNNTAIYYGLGAPVGGILPAIPNGVAPGYNVLAPFLARFSGTGAGDITLGAKIRLTGPKNPFGFSIIPLVKIPTTQELSVGLERGRSTGAYDYGVIFAVDGRLHKHVNLSANVGVIKVGDPKASNMNLGTLSGQAGVITGYGQSWSSLDLPNKLVSGIGLDFPLSKYLAFIAEMKSERYFGGQTPALLKNSPMDFVGGARIYPSRWFSISAAYQRHVNWMSDFDKGSSPNGLIFGLSIGHVNKREAAVLPNNPPTVAVSIGSVSNNTRDYTHPDAATVCAGDTVAVTADAKDPDGDTLTYKWTTTGGKIIGTGSAVTFDSTGLQPGEYQITCEVDDGCGCVAFDTKTIRVSRCELTVVCPSAPTVSVSTSSVLDGEAVTANAGGLTGGRNFGTPTYNWSVSGGSIASGQGTDSIRINTQGAGGSTVTVSLEVGGLSAECAKSASASFSVTKPYVPPAKPPARELSSCTTFKANNARVDNACKAVLGDVIRQLQADPQAQLIVDSYRGEKEKPADIDTARGKNVRDRLADGSLGSAIDANRIVVRPSGVTADGRQVRLWLVPQGADVPAGAQAATLGDITPEKKAAPAKKAKKKVVRKSTKKAK